MSLRTGRRFRGFQWTELAIPEWVINRVREIVDNEHAPKLDAEGCPVFQIDQDAPLPHDFYEEYEPGEQEYEAGERRDDADGEEQVEIGEDKMTLDDEQAEIKEDEMTLVDETVADEDASIDDESINDDAASDSERDNDSITDSDDSEYMSVQSGDEDSRNEAEEARPVGARVPPRNYEPSFGGKTYSLLTMQDPINHAAQRHLYTRAVNFVFN